MRISKTLGAAAGDCGVRRLGRGIRRQSGGILCWRGRRRIADPERRLLLRLSRLLQRLSIRLARHRRRPADLACWASRPNISISASRIGTTAITTINVSGSDSHPTAPALFAVGYLPMPMPFIDIFAKAGVARLSTNVTDFVQQPCPAGGPCPYFVPDRSASSHRHASSRTAPACNPSFPLD